MKNNTSKNSLLLQIGFIAAIIFVPLILAAAMRQSPLARDTLAVPGLVYCLYILYRILDALRYGRIEIGRTQNKGIRFKTNPRAYIGALIFFIAGFIFFSSLTVRMILRVG